MELTSKRITWRSKLHFEASMGLWCRNPLEGRFPDLRRIRNIRHQHMEERTFQVALSTQSMSTAEQSTL